MIGVERGKGRRQKRGESINPYFLPFFAFLPFLSGSKREMLPYRDSIGIDGKAIFFLYIKYAGKVGKIKFVEENRINS